MYKQVYLAGSPGAKSSVLVSPKTQKMKVHVNHSPNSTAMLGQEDVMRT